MEYRDLVKSIAEEALHELCRANKDNVMKVINRSHKRASELSKTKKPEDWTAKDMEQSIKQFKQQEYADKKFKTPQEKANYIKETIATMIDIQPVVAVGQEHPAKKEHEKKCKESK